MGFLPFTPGTWAAEKGRDIATQTDTYRKRVNKHVPGRVAHYTFATFLVLFFLDEFLIVLALFGPAVAIGVFGSLSAVTYLARTEKGRALTGRANTRMNASMPGRGSLGDYRTRTREK